MKLLVLTCLFLLQFAVDGTAQVVNTSYVTATGEKVLRLECTLPVDLERAWALFTTDQQLTRWIAPKAHIELRTGGYLLTNYNQDKPLTDSTSIRLDIINYLEKELLTLKVNLNNHFSKKVQEEDNHLQELLQFIPIAPGKTKVVSSMIGWGGGEDWDKTYDFFSKGNDWTYRELLKLFSR